ncbi:MAG: hypothetical protein AAF750_08550 [Planctomycetota bacterium]
MRRDPDKRAGGRSGDSASSAGAKRPRRWLRRMVWGGAIGGVLSLLSVTALWWMTQSTPAFYSAYLGQSEAEQELAEAALDAKLAALVESAYRETARASESGELSVIDGADGLERERDELAVMVSGVVPGEGRGGGPVRIDAVRELSLDNAELAALVARHLDEWMRQRGYVRPTGLKRPIVAVYLGQLHLAFTLQTERYTQTFSGQMALRLIDTGMAELSVSRLRAGELPLPVGGVSGYLDGRGGERARRIGEWLETLERVEFRPVLKLEHGVRARLVEFDLREDGIDLRLRLQDRQTYRRDNYQLAAGATVDDLGLMHNAPRPGVGVGGDSVLVGVPVE